MQSIKREKIPDSDPNLIAKKEKFLKHIIIETEIALQQNKKEIY